MMQGIWKAAVLVLILAPAARAQRALPGADTLGNRLVTHQHLWFDQTYGFTVGNHTFTVQRKKIQDSLFYKTADGRLHFFMLDTAEQEIYKGAPPLHRLWIPSDSCCRDSVFDPLSGILTEVDTTQGIFLASRFIFQVRSVHSFYEQMQWLEAFQQTHPAYRIRLFRYNGHRGMEYLTTSGFRQVIASLVSYMFKSEAEDWFVLKLFRPDTHFEEPPLDIILHYAPE